MVAMNNKELKFKMPFKTASKKTNKQTKKKTQHPKIINT